MNYYTDLFSPETYGAFGLSDRSITGFRASQRAMAEKVEAGDLFICYMTQFSRWIGLLEVRGPCCIDDSPLFYSENDPFVVRFPVELVVWLERDRTIPIREPGVWGQLSFTKGLEAGDISWTGILRRSLNRFRDEDGRFLESRLRAQAASGTIYEIDEHQFDRLATKRIRRADRVVEVTVPIEDDGSDVPVEGANPEQVVRESSTIQALLASIGEQMGFRVWIPRNDRSSVLKGWRPGIGVLIDTLPLNYDTTTLQTIEQIDVIWLKGRSIVRAFEVEHTTAIYSGLLRMADLLALQPNMDIKLHIVAPDERRAKVFNEIRRPVFSLLEKAPLSECCTFISYKGLESLAALPHLKHLSDAVLDEYAEDADL